MLLGEAVLDIQKRGRLSLDFLNLLPFNALGNYNKYYYQNTWILHPLYNQTMELFKDYDIFPLNDGSYTTKEYAKIARGGIREDGITKIFTNKELAFLTGKNSKWMPVSGNGGNFTETNENYSSLYKFLRDESQQPPPTAIQSITRQAHLPRQRG